MIDGGKEAGLPEFGHGGWAEMQQRKQKWLKAIVQ
jgi:hypothetical protein